jgi:hypothetical protein
VAAVSGRARFEGTFSFCCVGGTVVVIGIAKLLSTVPRRQGLTQWHLLVLPPSMLWKVASVLCPSCWERGQALLLWWHEPCVQQYFGVGRGLGRGRPGLGCCFRDRRGLHCCFLEKRFVSGVLGSLLEIMDSVCVAFARLERVSLLFVSACVGGSSVMDCSRSPVTICWMRFALSKPIWSTVGVLLRMAFWDSRKWLLKFGQFFSMVGGSYQRRISLAKRPDLVSNIMARLMS